MSFRNLIASILFLLAIATSSAFVPSTNNCGRNVNAATTTTTSSKTTLAFGFLKELGLEKPSWLPDFGGKKKEEAAAAAAAAETSAEIEGSDSETEPAVADEK